MRWIRAIAAGLAAWAAPGAPADEPACDAGLGARVAAVRAATPVLDVVVLVPDGASFVRAVAGWSRAGRYPVLIDDGTAEAAEDAARFVRAFQPARVLRWRQPDLVPGRDRSAAGRGAMEHAAASAWREGPDDEAAPWLADAFARAGHTPPGVVVAHESDPAWPAALTLAAGHGQVLAWVQARRSVDAAWALDEALDFARRVERACDESGLAWRELGDAIDGVTLCLNAPAKIRVGEREVVATTDVLGRFVPDVPAPAPGPAGQAPAARLAGARWGWAGQVFGSEAQAACRAMASLFLPPARAWVFDSYPPGPPWSDYDGREAAEALRRAGLEVMLDAAPSAGEGHWRARASRALRADLVLVNSKGLRDRFELAPGVCRAGDVPILDKPAAVVFVHSWSANKIGDRATIAGRWLERGAYAYAGSVHEPFLQAFVPTPEAARRLAGGSAWGAAVRVSADEAWKIAVIGDPLLTFTPVGARRAPGPGDALSGLPGAVDVAAEAAGLIDAGDHGAALRALVLLGRDADAARLWQRLVAEGAPTADAASAALMALFRTGQTAEFLAAYAALPAQQAAAPWRRDALWNILGPMPGGVTDPAALALLRAHLRDDQLGRDALEVSRAIAAASGARAAAEFLAGVRQRLTDPAAVREFDAEVNPAPAGGAGRARPPRAQPGRRRPGG